MAWLETKGTIFRIRFRYRGGKHLLALNTTDRDEAEDALGRFESNLRLIERGGHINLTANQVDARSSSTRVEYRWR